MRSVAAVQASLAAAKSLSFRSLTAIAVVALMAAVALGAVFVQVHSEAERTAAYYATLEQSLDVRSTLRRIFSNLQDAETGQRGFLITGDPAFLEPYTTAVTSLPAQLKSLLEAVDSPQQSRAVSLERLSRDKLNEMALTISAWKSLGPAFALEIVKAGTGKRLMDQIRDVVEEMVEAENQEIIRKTADLRAQTAHHERTTFALVIGMVLLVVIASGVTLRYMLHRRRAEQDLRQAWAAAEQARADAEEASRAKTDFLAAMSHEIRTPLNGIIGYTELLFDQALTPDQRRYLERIHFAGSALHTVVNDVLDFSKIEADRLDLHPHPFSLEALIDNTLSLVGKAAQQKELELKVLWNPALPKVAVGDEARLRQILLNLLNNAVKFTHEGSVTLEVQGSSGDPEMMRFAVTDTGIGIPPEQHEHLFQRFSQANSSIVREFGGTGLGLAISKRLVDLMGGRIGLESQEGKGSTFWFEVPLPRTNSQMAIEQQALTSPTATLSGRILLVEDLEHNRDLARTILRGAGHEVDQAVNGAEAVAAVQAKTYDLVLMDIQMPVMDGITATQQIRALAPPANTIPIIAMSANVLPQQVRSFKEAGMNDHVGKPFKRTELFQTINRWLPRASQEVSSMPAGMAAVDDLRQLMGAEWVDSALKRLREQINEAFGSNNLALENCEQLARHAHALVGPAALLGFSELSQLCSALEEACTAGRDLTGPFQQAQVAARSADRRASEMLT